MKIGKLRFLVAAGLATFLSAPPPARASQEECLFTSGELAALIGQPLREPEVSPPRPTYSLYCTFEAAGARGKKLVVSVRARETQQEFTALQRLARMTNKVGFSELKDVGRGAYAAPHGLRAWDGARSVYVSGLTGILKREITPEDASALLRLGLERLASHPDAGPAVDPGASGSAPKGASPGRTVAVKIVDRNSKKPLAGLLVEVTSSVPIPCLVPPCPVAEKQVWQGTSNENGILRFPASLAAEGAVVYAHAVGSDFAVDVHREGKRDGSKRPVLQLEPPR